jgi:predicted HicB family RNase H-like nuclease
MSDKPNRPGRPTLDVNGKPSAQVAVRLPQHEFDALTRQATQERVSLSELIRREIRRAAAAQEK